VIRPTLTLAQLRTSAGTGATVSQGGSLNDPLGLAISLDGNILTVNGNNGYMVTTTPDGNQISKQLLDSSGSPPGNGALFGLVPVLGQGLYYVDHQYAKSVRLSWGPAP
jgi:hypothetical protein